MSFKRVSLTVAALGAASSSLYIKSVTTFKSPLQTTDPVFSSQAFRRFNSFSNPTSDDECLREIPLSRIRPELLENEGDLALEFCRRIWSSRIGFGALRIFFSLTQSGPGTSSHLWTRQQLATSKYDTGTGLVNFFNVVEKRPDDITIRFGDSLEKEDMRPQDGLFVIRASIDRHAGVARLSLKTLVFCGDKKTDSTGVPAVGEWVHSWVARLWMVTGSWGLMR